MNMETIYAKYGSHLQPKFSVVHLVQSGAHDWNQEAVVEVVKELAAHKRVCHLYYSVAEFKTVHEKH